MNRTFETPADSTVRVYRSLGCYRSGDSRTHGFASYWGTRPPESDLVNVLRASSAPVDFAGAVTDWRWLMECDTVRFGR